MLHCGNFLHQAAGKICHQNVSTLLTVAADKPPIQQHKLPSISSPFFGLLLSDALRLQMLLQAVSSGKQSDQLSSKQHHLHFRTGGQSLSWAHIICWVFKTDCACCRYDIETVRSVRQFRGHTDRITDLRMSADARWLLSSSLDGTLRVWDVPSARCLQVSPSADASFLPVQITRAPETQMRKGRHCGRESSCSLAKSRSLETCAKLIRVPLVISDYAQDITVQMSPRLTREALHTSTALVLRRLCMQVLKLGPPVTALSLSPTMDMLATTHVNRRGIYMWSNAAVYGSGADIRPSELPVDARLPALASGDCPSSGNMHSGEDASVCAQHWSFG